MDEEPTGHVAVALIGDFGERLPGLAVHIMKTGELPQRPEDLVRIADRALDRIKAILAGEGQEARQKPDQTAVSSATAMARLS